VRVKVAAASINFPDLLIVEGKYKFRPELPFVPGSEYAGVVEAVGEGVTHLSAGDRVACAGHGGFGTHALVEARQAVPLPSGIAFEDAAAFLFTYGTSLHALMDRGALKAGETVLDQQGLALAPGFIDMHSHGNRGLTHHLSGVGKTEAHGVEHIGERGGPKTRDRPPFGHPVLSGKLL
jgi:hypothetical protein